MKSEEGPSATERGSLWWACADSASAEKARRFTRLLDSVAVAADKKVGRVSLDSWI